MTRTGHRLGVDAPSIGLLILRIGAGGFLLPHGVGKLLGWFGGPGIEGFADELQYFGLPAAGPVPLVLALMQTGLGILVLAGAWTRLSALAAAAFLGVTMALNLSNGWFWMHGGVEYPALWLLVHLALVATGAGALSVDAMGFARNAVAGDGLRR
jgi:putative oxidoreductase